MLNYTLDLTSDASGRDRQMPMPILLAIAPFGLLLTSTTPHAPTVTARRAMSPVAVDAQQAASLTSALNFNDPNVQASFGAIAAALIGGVAYANNKKEPSTESSAPPSAAPVTVAVAVYGEGHLGGGEADAEA